MKTNDYYLSYSPIQKCFDVQPLDKIIRSNINALSRDVGHATAYMIIAGPGASADMSKARIAFEAEFGRPS